MTRAQQISIMHDLEVSASGETTLIAPESLPYLQCLALFRIAAALDVIAEGLPEAGRGV